MREIFFDKDFLNHLEHLVFLSKKVFIGEKGGDQRSRSYGIGLEYADHREYNSGDDIRYIDWALYGRSGRLYTKLFLEDKDKNINILIDRSRSMDFGAAKKFQYALTLGASLGYVGLCNLDHVGAGYFSEDMGKFIPPRRGRNQVFPYFEFLCSFEAASSTNLNRSLENFATMVKQPGLVVILSDFFDEKGYERGLKYLLYKRYEVHIIQILCKEEIRPDLSGNVRMYNIEGENYNDVDIDDDSIERYHRELTQYNSKLKAFCDSTGILYLQAVTDIPFNQLLTRYFKMSYEHF